MKIELADKNELATILDGLAALPLARSYNLFTKLYLLLQAPPSTAESPVPPQPLSE